MASTLVHAVFCPKCHHLVYSVYHHDFRECPCGSIYVDGGFDYTRVGGNPIPETFKLSVNADKKTLAHDYKSRPSLGRKYGCVHISKVRTKKGSALSLLRRLSKIIAKY